MALNHPERRARRVWDQLDHRAVLRGTKAYLAIAVPCGVLIALTHSGGWMAVAEVLLLVAPIVGGAVAAASGDRAPLTQSAVAVGIPTILFFALRIIDGIVKGSLDATLITTLALYLAIVVGLAVLAGYVVFRRRSRPA